MKIQIVTDSHSSISQDIAKELGISVIPMPFMINGESILEGSSISRKLFLDLLKKDADVSTSQPAPGMIMEHWDRILEDADKIIYIPISSGLSGGCATAKFLAQDEKYADKVYVVDNGRVAALQYQSVLDAIALRDKGYSPEEICVILERVRGDMIIYITPDSLHYLKKGGRVSSSTALVGNLLNIKPVLQFTTGMLSMYKKCRGLKAAKKTMLSSIKNDLETRFAEQHKKGLTRIMIATSADDEPTEEWINDIKTEFPGMDVLYAPLSMAISCHIGPGGFGIGVSCIPEEAI